jgi:hypothetical protein
MILITESLTQLEVCTFYRVSNLYVSPHKTEGLGYTILESIENDCPVLATNFGGFKDIIEDDFIKLNYVKTISKKNDNVYFNHIWCEPIKNDLLELMEKYYLNKNLLLNEIEKSKNKLKNYDSKNNSSKIFKRLCSIHYFVNKCYDIKYTKNNIYNAMSPNIYKYMNTDLFNITNTNKLIEHHNNNCIIDKRICGYKINNSFFNNLQKTMLFDEEFYIKSNMIHNIIVENKEYDFYYNNYVSKKTFISKQVKNIFNKYIQSQIHVSKIFNEKMHSIIFSGNQNDYILNIKNFKKTFLLIFKEKDIILYKLIKLLISFNFITFDILKKIYNELDENEKYRIKFNQIWSNCLFSLKKKYIHLDNISLNNNSNKVCVLIECRKHIYIEPVMKHMIQMLRNDNWNFAIVCGNDNYNYVSEIFKNITNLKIINLNVKTLHLNNSIFYDNNNYNALFKSKNFWNLFNEKHILITQTDTLLLKNNLNNFLSYDYIGSPWPLNVEWNLYNISIGNGGFSLRNKDKMLEIIEKHYFLNNIEDALLPEDCYFSKYLHNDYSAIIPDYKEGLSFAVECIYDNKNLPVGLHKPMLDIETLKSFLSNIYSDNYENANTNDIDLQYIFNNKINSLDDVIDNELIDIIPFNFKNIEDFKNTISSNKIEYNFEKLTFNSPVKIFMYIFPQFHSIPENDKFWGKDFTEWTNVKKTKKIIENQYIIKPHNDIGYYNLLELETRQRYTEYFLNQGWYGFIYCHFWFEGKPVMDKVINKILDDSQPNVPFFFNFINEPWTKRWDGGNNEIMLNIDYNFSTEHINFLLPYFKNNLYIKIDNKPLFGIYLLDDIPDDYFKKWEHILKENGFDGVYIIKTLNHREKNTCNNFENQFLYNPNYCNYVIPDKNNNFLINQKPLDKYNYMFNEGIFNEGKYIKMNPDIKNAIENKKLKSGKEHYLLCGSNEKHTRTLPAIVKDNFETYEKIESLHNNNNNTWGGTFVRWDNTYRHTTLESQPTIFLNNNSFIFYNHLKKIFKINDKIVINALNEWGEGCVIEPSEEFNYSYFKALKLNIENSLI